ncbi:MAG: bifunctional metallophosphatase/5'-nucleotidase [Clostridia bacterium]|nr:bifunctional metallophosphatase/5'-nucleotidase [Clostridia bacterium]
MKKLSIRVLSVLLAVLMLTSLSVTAFAASADDAAENVTVLFTHDLHSHLLPSKDEDGGEFGGYARLMTVIRAQREKYPDSILVDGGDFSMGSLFQTAYTTSATELRMMGAMGYDATVFGNHEYDYLPAGLASMLNAAAASGDPVPAILNANYLPPAEGEDGYNAELSAALDIYGVKKYTILERGGVYFVLFGITGIDSDKCAPNSGMILEDAATAAAEVVSSAIAECKQTYGADPVVICLSHGGTSDGKGEDYDLAEAVDGIDLIVSGHTHTKLDEPIEVNGTYIVSADEYGKYLGVVRLKKDADGVSLADYELIPVDENVEDDAEISALVESFKNNVEEEYLADYGVGFDEVLVNNTYDFENVDEVKATQHESTLTNIFSDAYKWAVEKATGEKVDMALTAAGVIRDTLPMGPVTTSDVFNAASLGVGTEGELIAIYLTGQDLLNVLEVDASVQPLMSSAQLYCSGVEYSFNTNRMLFNKVDYSALRRDDGTTEQIDPEGMYRVVTGMYCGQMLGEVKSKSFGLLSITPRDEKGNEIAVADLVNYVVRDGDGVPVKEWYAIASYLKEMGGEMDPAYAEPDGRKVVYSSLDPVKLLRNANKFTYILIAVIVVVLAIVIGVPVLIVRSVKKRRAKKAQAK